jgi:RNA polymerase sigma factor (sigma-70 family)
MREREGDIAATDRFLRATHASLVRSLTGYIGDRHIAEDLAQEAMARFLARPPGRTVHSPEAYLHTIGLNVARSWLRRRAVERRAGRRPIAVADFVAQSPVDDDDIHEAMRLRRLPARQREAISLRFLADLDVSRTALVMRCKEGTVRALTSQGIARLRRELGDYMSEVSDE